MLYIVIVKILISYFNFYTVKKVNVFFINFLVFLSDYLKYTDCYKVINTDWDRCVSKFMSLVREELNINRSDETKMLNLCW